MTQTCCSHFGNGLADLVPGSRIGKKYRCIPLIFGSEGAKLTSFCADSIERYGVSGCLVL